MLRCMSSCRNIRQGHTLCESYWIIAYYNFHGHAFKHESCSQRTHDPEYGFGQIPRDCRYVVKLYTFAHFLNDGGGISGKIAHFLLNVDLL